VILARLVILPVLTIAPVLPVIALLVVIVVVVLARLLIVVAALVVALLIGLLLLIARRMRLHGGLRLVVAIVETIVRVAVGPRLRLLLLLEGLVLPELLLRRRDQAEIMLGVLIIILGSHRIAGARGIAGKLNVFFGDVIGGPADLHVRAVRFVNARQRIVILASASASAASTITTPHAMVLVLTVPHSLPFRQPC
jgi:hypothetical protein